MEGEGGGAVAQAEAEQAGELRLLAAESGGGGGEVGAARLEVGILALAVANSAPVVAQARPAGPSQRTRQALVHAVRADPGLGAAGDEQQARRTAGGIEAGAERRALAGDAQKPSHPRSHCEMSEAIASASSGEV